jgi:hypothetical protein
MSVRTGTNPLVLPFLIYTHSLQIQMPSALCAHLFGHCNCPVLSGSGAVYRICAGTSTFHLLQAVLLVHLHSPPACGHSCITGLCVLLGWGGDRRAK